MPACASVARNEPGLPSAQKAPAPAGSAANSPATVRAKNTGTAAFLSVFESLFNVMKAMAREGYTIELPNSGWLMTLALRTPGMRRSASRS